MQVIDLPSIHACDLARYAATFLFKNQGGLSAYRFVKRKNIPLSMFLDEMLELSGLERFYASCSKNS